MRVLFVSLLILFTAVVLALLAHQDPGYILIKHGPDKIETTLTLALAALALSFFALYYLIRFITHVWALPRRLEHWQDRRQRLKARNTLTRGLLQLEEGEWAEAELNLTRYATDGEPPLLHYLAAARAAQKQGAHDRRDHYLRLAHQSTSGADIAVGLTQAELQLHHHQTEQALATLQHLSTLAPKHTYVQKLLMQMYIELDDWNHLLPMLPGLRKRKVINEAEAYELEFRAYVHQLDQVGHQQNLADLQGLWERIPKRFRLREELLLSYVQQLHSHDADAPAEVLLREALKKNWSDRLIHFYGLLETPDPSRQLGHAEAWLTLHGKDPVLLLTLGRLCLRNRLWGKGRAYFESSAGLSPCLETFQELGTLLEQMQEPEAALEYYRKGVRLVAGPTTPALPYTVDKAELPARMEVLTAETPP